MKMYETRDFASRIKEFIKTCPFLDKYDVNFSDITFQKLSGEKSESSALDYLGSVVLNSSSDLLGQRIVEKQANFAIWFTKKSEYDIYREETTEFLWNFEQWVENCQYSNLTPKISSNSDYYGDEYMWADNGTFSSVLDKNEETRIYMINLHIRYYNVYTEEE